MAFASAELKRQRAHRKSAADATVSPPRTQPLPATAAPPELAGAGTGGGQVGVGAPARITPAAPCGATVPGTHGRLDAAAAPPTDALSAEQGAFQKAAAGLHQARLVSTNARAFSLSLSPTPLQPTATHRMPLCL